MNRRAFLQRMFTPAVLGIAIPTVDLNQFEGLSLSSSDYPAAWLDYHAGNVQLKVPLEVESATVDSGRLIVRFGAFHATQECTVVMRNVLFSTITRHMTPGDTLHCSSNYVVWDNDQYKEKRDIKPESAVRIIRAIRQLHIEWEQA